ncbi:MAG: toll/interleukin-1 receptor domain-containing protein [Oscillospiraceae bacterium]|nr:toll/interleukin-1 receptor domain-containing protein [Oscillospiraceae bacterium]
MRKLPFHSYTGDEPYLFVSYAHKDDERVYAILRALRDRRVRIWYDEGIEVGANWPQTVAEHLRGAETVVVFTSEQSAGSQNCRREINFGVSQRKKLLVVRLDESDLPPDMSLQLAGAPTIDAQDAEATAEAIAAQLSGNVFGDVDGGETAERRGAKKSVNGWFIASLALALLLAGAVLLLLGRMNGWFGAPTGVRREQILSEELGEVSVTRFTSRATMELLLRSLEGDSLCLCGNSLVSDARAIEHGADGWTIGGESVERGLIEDLDFLAGADLTELTLINENLTSLAGIEALPSLTYLDLSDDLLADLTPLTGLEQLRSLRVLCLPAETELTVLTRCPALREVYVSYDMIDRIKPLVEAGIDVIVQK